MLVKSLLLISLPYISCSVADWCSCPVKRCVSTDCTVNYDICPCRRVFKRSTDINIAPIFAPQEDQVLNRETHRCNSESLEKVMLENIGDDVKQSKIKVMEAAEALLGGNFNVVCAHGDFSYITSTKLYCLTGNEAVKCYAFLSYTRAE